MQRWALIIGLLGLTLNLGCGRRASTPAAAEGPDEAAPRQVSYDARFALNQGERRRAAIAAGRMEQYSRGDSTFSLLLGAPDTLQARAPSRVTAWLFDAEGDSSATLTADSLIYFDARGQFEAFGDVEVVTQTDKQLRSEYLTWDEADRMIRTDRFVQITTPSERVEGYGLVAEENLDTYQIGRFTAQVTIDEGEAPPDTTQS
ncbi:MAG: LPS export ABC transporter periplasmic protein LptC [Bacteroidetes bacterium]|jgi:LPS export ABC transporter protein LptC|nr:LPS export ABC transporter periplasmic protein LptC [Bacteroidota bacterium]